MNDYSFMFAEDEIKTDLEKINVKGRFLKDNYEANSQFTSMERIRVLLSKGV